MREGTQKIHHTPEPHLSSARTTESHFRMRAPGQHSTSEPGGAGKGTEVQPSPLPTVFFSLQILEYIQYCKITTLISTKETKQA